MNRNRLLWTWAVEMVGSDWGTILILCSDWLILSGLLVYILTMEGHSGVGYDIRRRNIWSWYPDTVQLKEMTIVPSLDTVLPQVS